MAKYEWPDQIPDEDIIKQYKEAEEVVFSARRFNYIKYRQISFGDLGWWLPLARVLPLIGVTPVMLRPVFNPQTVMSKRKFPFNRRWLGLNKNTIKLKKVELPEKPEDYKQLGSFSLADEPFKKLAEVLGKTIKIMREDGGTGEHYHLFTATPSGEIIEPE